MKNFCCIVLLILIIFHGTVRSNRTQAGLSCVNDYLTNISCVWWNSTDFSAQRCLLEGNRDRIQVDSCELLPLNTHSHSARGCSVTFDMDFFFLDKIFFSVTCNESLVTMMVYVPARHIKTHPPDKPTVSGVNITWSRGVKFPKDIEEFEFQLQFKSKHTSWELAKPQRVSGGTYVELDHSLLTVGEQYQARVRVKPVEPRDEGHFRGEWSDWSPAVTWTSEVGKPESTEPVAPALPDDIRTFLIISFHVLLITAAVSFIIYKANKSNGFLKTKRQHVPDPSKYFQALHTVHGGNFRKWLGCQNPVGPFLTPQSCDDISPVEVFNVWDPGARSSARLLHCGQLDSALETSGTSHASSGISNMGYFYSKSLSGSMQLETCPVYFSYHPEEDATSAFSSPGSSHDRPASPSLQLDPLMSPDSGFDMPEECDEDRDDEGHVLLSFITSLPQGSLCSVRALQSSVPVPVFTPRAEPVNSPGCSSASEAAEGAAVRPASLIEPSASGYLTLKEMQKYSNKSI